jgi:phage recombination protein Bet
MANELIKYNTDHGEVELSPQIIRNYLVPSDSKVTDQEVQLFLKLCEYQKLNPFLREVYLVKYGNYPASIVTGKEVFTKRAMANPSFNGLEAGIVIVSNGKVVRREGSMKLPGEQLVGGWARVHIKGHAVPFSDEVSLEEYIGKKADGTPTQMWATKPGTMIRKVAIVHALREAFPEMFEGLYSQEEINKIDSSTLPETPVVVKDITDDCPNVVPVADSDGVVYADAVDITPEPPKQEAPKDINNVFMPDVQYRVEKVKSGTNPKNNAAYVKSVIKEAGFSLELYDNECHQVNEGDFIIIRKMSPIKSREYNGRTYYSTNATIDLANNLTDKAFTQSILDEQIPVPWDE